MILHGQCLLVLWCCLLFVNSFLVTTQGSSYILLMWQLKCLRDLFCPSHSWGAYAWCGSCQTASAPDILGDYCFTFVYTGWVVLEGGGNHLELVQVWVFCSVWITASCSRNRALWLPAWNTKKREQRSSLLETNIYGVVQLSHILHCYLINNLKVDIILNTKGLETTTISMISWHHQHIL